MWGGHLETVLGRPVPGPQFLQQVNRECQTCWGGDDVVSQDEMYKVWPWPVLRKPSRSGLMVSLQRLTRVHSERVFEDARGTPEHARPWQVKA